MRRTFLADDICCRYRHSPLRKHNYYCNSSRRRGLYGIYTASSPSRYHSYMRQDVNNNHHRLEAVQMARFPHNIQPKQST